MALAQGFEPRLTDPESVALPLYYASIDGGREPRDSLNFSCLPPRHIGTSEGS